MRSIANPGPVAALAIVSALALNYFFIPPLYTLTIDKPEDWLLFGVYFLVAFETSALVSRSRARASLLKDRERAANFLFGASQVVSDSRSPDEAAKAAAELVKSHYRTEAFVLLDDGEGRLAKGLEAREYDIASYAYAERKICGSRTSTLPNAAFRYIPAFTGETTVGVIGITMPEDGVWTNADDDLIQSLGRTLALAIERRRSETRIRETSLKLESERLGAILLD